MGQHRLLGSSGVADHSVRHYVLQPDKMWLVSEVARDPNDQGAPCHPVQLILKPKGLDGVKGT